MRADKNLIADVRKHINGSSAGRVAYVESRIDSYLIACLLSRGGDEARSAHWHRKAIELRVELEAIAGRKFAETLG